MKWLKAAFISLSLGMVSLAQAAVTPQELIQTTSQQLAQRLEADKDKLKSDPGVVVGIVNDVLLPNIDVDTIARKVLGKHWKSATPEQQKKFTTEFKTYLVRFYSRIFANYNGEKLEMLPAVPSDDPEFATVKTQIVQGPGKTIPVDYRLQKTDSGDWKVIDFKAEGISLVINNQKQYSSQVSQEGLDTVIAKLSYNNSQPMTK